MIGLCITCAACSFDNAERAAGACRARMIAELQISFNGPPNILRDSQFMMACMRSKGFGIAQKCDLAAIATAGQGCFERKEWF